MVVPWRGEGRRRVASISAGEQLCAKPETNTICHDRDKRFRLSVGGKCEGARLVRGLPESTLLDAMAWAIGGQPIP